MLSTVSPALSAIPYVGTILSAAGTIAGGLMQKSAAEKQAKQAEQVRKQALATQKQALRPEFANKKRLEEMAYLSGLPALSTAQQNIDEDIASNIRAIRDSSPSGGTAVQAISAALQMGNKAKRNLDIQNAEFKANKLSDVGRTEWAIGEKQRQLEDIRDAQKREGLIAASAFENAATANKMNAANMITGALTSTGAALGKTAQNQQYMKMLENTYGAGGGATTTTPTTTNTITSVPLAGGGSIMTDNTTVGFGDNTQRLQTLLNTTQALEADDIDFLTGMYNNLAISGRKEDADIAKQIQQLLQANR